MFGFGFTEILLILTVALLVLGPEKLPETARQLGRFVANLRSAMDGLRDEFDLENLSNDKPPRNTLRAGRLISTDNTCEDTPKTVSSEKGPTDEISENCPTGGDQKAKEKQTKDEEK